MSEGPSVQIGTGANLTFERGEVGVVDGGRSGLWSLVVRVVDEGLTAQTSIWLGPEGVEEPNSTFVVSTGGELVAIPQRIYNPEPRSFRALSETQQLMLHCLYSRHHDGFVRQKHLRALVESREDWVSPFVVRLIGEYVLPIVQDIQAAIAASPVERGRLARFAGENPLFMELTRQRAVSYWNAYHRHDYPHAIDYPGIAALNEL